MKTGITKQYESDGDNFSGAAHISPAPSPSISAKEKAQDDFFMPPDSDDICWQVGAESFSRKEVAYLLYTQRAMISNDLRRHCGNDMTNEMFEILDDPRIPVF